MSVGQSLAQSERLVNVGLRTDPVSLIALVALAAKTTEILCGFKPIFDRLAIRLGPR
jgi:hypothetical protein